MGNKILVVDDSKDLRTLLTMVLRTDGYDVVEASSADQALTKLKDETLPDMIFLDHSMEDMDGPDFLIELERRHPEVLQDVPVIMLTAKSAEEIPMVRITEIVSKPVGIEQILALAKRYLH